MNRLAAAIALVAAIALATFGIVRGTWAVGGSDSSCYGLMAAAFGKGDWQPTSALAIAPWPDALRTVAAAGFIPSPVRPHAASPICAPGFSLLMAPFVAMFGRDAIFLINPIAAATLIWSVFLIGKRLADGMAGSSAAVLTAASPIVLYQVVQPMNDITSAALWIGAIAIASTSQSNRSAVATGLVAGLAILVRPNLAPLVLVVATMVRPIPFVIALVPAVASLLTLNQVLYGHPLSSGYGDVAPLFRLAHLEPNATNYGRAFVQTQTIFPLVSVLAIPVLTGAARRLAVTLLAAAAVVIGIYLLYQPFEEWWYLRFLLPAIPLLIVVACAAATVMAARMRMKGVIAIGVVVLASLGLRTAGQRDVLALQRLEGRFRDTSMLVRDRLPENAVLITVWQSGSIRFHADREIVMWDAMDPSWLDRAVAWINDSGRRAYILVERREEPLFRARFRGHSELGGLDWPPRFDYSRVARIFDPSDRARSLAGEQYPTENVGVRVPR